MKLKKKNCPNCGAPITTEICKYCNTTIGLDTENSNLEYPVIDCKEVDTEFKHIFILLFMVFVFEFFGIVWFVILDLESDVFGKLASLLFIIGGLLILRDLLASVIRIVQVKLYGKEIDAIVYGYLDDIPLIDEDKPTKIVKLLITTKDGPKFILYQLGGIIRPFEINSKIKLLVYKDKVLIVNKKKYYF